MRCGRWAVAKAIKIYGLSPKLAWFGALFPAHRSGRRACGLPGYADRRHHGPDQVSRPGRACPWRWIRGRAPLHPASRGSPTSFGDGHPRTSSRPHPGLRRGRPDTGTTRHCCFHKWARRTEKWPRFSVATDAPARGREHRIGPMLYWTAAGVCSDALPAGLGPAARRCASLGKLWLFKKV